MLKLIGKLGFVALVGMAVLGVWRAYTYSPQTADIRAVRPRLVDRRCLDGCISAGARAQEVMR